MIKLVITGESGVGKSSLLLRFTDDLFDQKLSSTVGVDYIQKHLTVNGKITQLAIWDTVGQERFLTLTPIFYRGAQGFILVYDVTNRDTFKKLDFWLNELESYATNPSIVKMLIANKIDKRFRQVNKEEGLKFAEKHSMLYFEASAKTKEGVHISFEELVENILQNPELWESRSNVVNLNQCYQRKASGSCLYC